jgi:hypothetical protein
MDHGDFTKQLDEVGLGRTDLPRSTLRNWARAGLIPGPSPYTKKGKRGRFRNWPDEAVEEAAAVWALRNLESGWFLSPPPSDAVKRIKFEADSIHKKLKNDVNFCRHFGKKSFDPEGRVGYYLKSYDLHPFIVTRIATIEKVRYTKSVRETAKVVFLWNEHSLNENGEEPFEWKFNRVIFESSNENHVVVRFEPSPELKEKQLSIMRADLKKYGLRRLSAEEWTEIENSAARKKDKRDDRLSPSSE